MTQKLVMGRGGEIRGGEEGRIITTRRKVTKEVKRDGTP